MSNTDPRVDAYIARHPLFAPVLTHLRELIRETCPKATETIKWGMPAYEYHGLLCGFAAFKAHCVFSLWKGNLVLADDGTRADEAMGQFGRLQTLADLPSKATLRKYIKQAMRLNEDGVKVPRVASTKPKPAPTLPDDLRQALAQRGEALKIFAAFSPSKQRDYVEWLDEAKQATTRSRRLQQAVEWIAEGKSRNWKYERT